MPGVVQVFGKREVCFWIGVEGEEIQVNEISA